MGAAHTVCHTTATAPRQPMAALARGLGAACRISVARLRPAESDVRSMSSTRSKTVGAVRQVRGGAEAGFWVVCWVHSRHTCGVVSCRFQGGPPTLAHDRSPERLDESRAPHLTSASAVAKFLCKTKKKQSEVVATQATREGGG